jgi:hypothetical protein
MGMNKPTRSRRRTMNGEAFQNRVKRTMRNFTSKKRMTR